MELIPDTITYDEATDRYKCDRQTIRKAILEFCLQFEGLNAPCLVSNREMPQPYNFSQKGYFPETQAAIPGGGVCTFRINTKVLQGQFGRQAGDGSGYARLRSSLQLCRTGR